MSQYLKTGVLLPLFLFALSGAGLLAQAQEGAQPTQEPAAPNQPAQETVPDQGEQTTEQFSTENEVRWVNEDYRSYSSAFRELERLSDVYSRNKLRLALTSFQTGKSIINQMHEEVRKINLESVEGLHLAEKWYWQTIDRKLKEERMIRNLKRRSKIKAVTHYTRAIHNLDEVQNRQVRDSDEFQRLLSSTYIEWVLHQYDLGNVSQCADILERYIALDPSYEREVTPHKYLASVYAYKERMLVANDAGSEREILFYKKKKNQHLLRAAELKYTKDSLEYEKMIDLVNRDEIIAVSP